MLQVAPPQACALAPKMLVQVGSCPGLVPSPAVAPVTLISSAKLYLPAAPPRSPAVTPLGRHCPEYFAQSPACPPAASVPTLPGHATVRVAVGLSVSVTPVNGV